MNPSSTLLGQAPPTVVAALLERADGPLLTALVGGTSAPHPRVLACAVEDGGIRVRTAAARNPTLPPDTLRQLADDLGAAPTRPGPSERELAALVLEHPRATRAVLLAVARLAERTGLPAELHRSPASALGPSHLYALVEVPDPRAVTYAVSGLRMGVGAGRTVLVHACLRLWGLAGREAAAAAFARLGAADAWSDADARSLHVRDTLADALRHDTGAGPRPDAGIDALRDLSAVLRGTPHVAELLRASCGNHSRQNAAATRAVLQAPHHPLDWNLLAREHAARPWCADVRTVLADQPGSPGPLAPARTRDAGPTRGPAHRTAVKATALKALRTPHPGMGAIHPAVIRARELGLLSVEEVLTSRLRAYQVLSLGAHLRDADQGDAAYATLHALAAHHLADNPDAWAVALQLLPEFAGSIRELLDTAARAVA